MYKLLKNLDSGEVKFVIRTTDNTTIPFVEANVDYQEYLKWIAAGNQPTPADEVKA